MSVRYRVVDAGGWHPPVGPPALLTPQRKHRWVIFALSRTQPDDYPKGWSGVLVGSYPSWQQALDHLREDGW